MNESIDEKRACTQELGKLLMDRFKSDRLIEDIHKKSLRLIMEMRAHRPTLAERFASNIIRVLDVISDVFRKLRSKVKAP